MSLNRRDFLSVVGLGAASFALGVGPAEAAAFTLVKRDFAVPSAITGQSRKVSLAARPGSAGGFVAVFESDSGATQTPSYARFYSRSFKPVGRNELLAKTTYSGSVAGSIVMQPDGSANVFFYGWPPDELDLFWMQRFDRNGRKVGAPVLMEEGLEGDTYLAVRLAGGNILTAWRGSGSGQNNGRVVEPDGSSVAFNAGGLCNGPLDALAPLADGGAVVGYFGPDMNASFQMLTDRARRRGAAVRRPALYAFGGLTVASHPKGFVGVWKEELSDGSPMVGGEIFDFKGRSLARLARQPLRPLANEDKYRDLNAQALSLADGRVVVVADSVRRDPVDGSKRFYEILAWLFAPDGQLIGGPDVLYAKAAKNELWDYLHRPRSLIQLSDRSLMLGFDGGYDSGLHSARALVFKPR